MSRNVIESDFRTSKMAAEKEIPDQSEMARNAIESEFRPFKMATGGHFVKYFNNKKLRINLKWPDMRSKVIFGHP